MITEAKVIAEVPGSNGHKWYVNIPILNGIPNSVAESNIFKAARDKNLALNSTLDESLKLTPTEILDKTRKSWSSQDIMAYTTEAVICGFVGASNLVQPNDNVYVGFLNNDMGQPIILGHFTNPEVPSISKPSLKIGSLRASGKVSLPAETSFIYTDPITGSTLELSFKDILTMKRLLDNFQTQFSSGVDSTPSGDSDNSTQV